MATDVERLIVRLEATQRQFEKQLRAASQTADRRARQIETRFMKMNKNLEAGASRLGGRLVAAFAGAAAIRGAQQLIDAAVRIENALKVAGLSGEALTQVYDDLFASAQRNAVPLEAMAVLYGRIAQAQDALKVSQEEMTNFTDKIGVALRVSGASAQEASGALLQLSQALGAGIVRAEEYNSINEGARPILQAVAAGLKEAGGDVAKLRNLVMDGKVSSEAFFRAFEAGAVILEDKVAAAQLTVSQQFVRLQNVLIKTAGEFNDATGASDAAGRSIERLADSVEVLGQFLARAANGPVGQFIAMIGELDERARSLFGFLSRFSLNDELFDWSVNLVAPESPMSTRDALRQRIQELREQASGMTDLAKDLGFNNDAIEAEIRRLEDLLAGTYGDGGPSTRGGRRGVPAGTKTVSLSDFELPSDDDEKGKKTRLDDLQREIQQITERTAAIRAMTEAQATLNPLIDDYGYAVEKAAAVQDLLTAAQRAGITVTPELRAQIEQLAEGYAQAVVEAERLAEAQDRTRERAEELRSVAQDVMSGFINDLQSGTNAAEALLNALSKIANKLLDIALNSIFDSLFPGTGKGGPMNLLPSAKGNAFNNGRVIPFAKGGIVNRPTVFPMAKGAGLMGEAGPEAILPLRRGPGGKLGVEASGGAQQVHLVVTSRIDRDGNIIPIVERVSQRTMQAGLAHYDRNVFPARFAQVAGDPRRRY